MIRVGKGGWTDGRPGALIEEFAFAFPAAHVRAGGGMMRAEGGFRGARMGIAVDSEESIVGAP